MRLGKLTNEQLEHLILSKFQSKRPEVTVAPGVGLDCAAVDLGEKLCVVSSDPITGAARDLGMLAVHVNCNDAAAAGADPIGILTTLLLPPDCDEALIERIACDIAQAANVAGVDVLGGHTEITDAVTRPVICATVLAAVAHGALVTSGGLRSGDDLVLTKWAGLEGSVILAGDFEQRSREVLSDEEILCVRSWSDCLSVVKEGRIAVAAGAHALHDVTEGGVLGAVWEMAAASGCGVDIASAAIPVKTQTRKLCGHLGLDALRLIASGCMLVGCENGQEMVACLRDAGIEAACIGHATDGGLFCDGKLLAPPDADELMKVK